MLVLCSSGISAFVAALYFVIANINPKFNIFMCVALLLCIVQTLIACFYGQLLSDESEKMYNVLWDCPWYSWDKSNKGCLIMMLMNCKQPFRITCYGLVVLNFKMLLSAIRLSYSLFALAIRYK
uniref:Odorant receptor 2a-like n=1 Tax=Diabrotica virgifera virgifera TaxID=50390 RepID=A0A6P7FD33_DIAVI